MSQSKVGDRILFWIIIVGGLIMGIVSLITWPFRAIARRLPGRREKLLNAEIDERRVDLQSSRKLLDALAGGDPKSAAKFEKIVAKAEAEIAKVLGDEGWPEDFESEFPGSAVVEILEKLNVIDGMDWRSTPEDLRMTLAPLLKRRGIALDWSFIKEVEAIVDDGKALSNPHFLPVVGDHLEKLGFRLALIIEGSDAYTFAICTPEEFAQIDGLASRSFKIWRASSATGPVPEP